MIRRALLATAFLFGSALAVGSDKPVASLPEGPTMSEVLSGFGSVAWFGIVAPPKTPARASETPWRS
jgi:tripartite-type tricarboxylate transporter receptor subunit TctC